MNWLESIQTNAGADSPLHPAPLAQEIVSAQEVWLGISSRLGGRGPKCSTGDYEYPAFGLRLAGGLVAIPRGKRESYGMKKPKRSKKKNAARNKAYHSYIDSFAWKSFKDRWRLSSLYKGEFCHALGCGRKDTLQFHHRSYENFGRENLSDVVLVCRSCHKKIHKLNDFGFTLKEATDAIIGSIGKGNRK